MRPGVARMLPRSISGALLLMATGCGREAEEEVSPYGPSTISPALDPTYEGRTLDGWVSALAARDPADRYVALLALAEFTEEAKPHVAAIEARLADAAASVRWAALETLGRLNEAAAPSARAIVDRFDDGDEGVRRAAARAAGRLGMPAADLLIARFDRSEDEARALVKGALLAIGPGLSDRVPEFAKRLVGDDSTLAEDAADVLTAIGAPAVEILCAAVADPRALTAVTAAIALGRVGPTAGAAGAVALERALTRRGDVRTTALDALAQLGAPGDAALARAAESPDADLARAARARRRPAAPNPPK